MALAGDFEQIVSSLPEDWTDLELDLRIADEGRYVDAGLMLAQINAQPYSRADWHWRINVAHRFGHAAAPETVHGILTKLDRERIEGELRIRDAREGRAEVVQMWGRPESVRREFRRRRSLYGELALARVVAIVSDLMLASRVTTSLAAAGHEVEQESALPDELDGVDLVVADLDAIEPEKLGGLGVPVLGFYQHTDVDTKAAADAAGVDLAVPRSRMVRELPELVERLASG